MRKKFKIMYPQDHPDEEKRGKAYNPPEESMVVMSGGGVFFLYHNEAYYPSIGKLSNTLEKYDVVWR